MVFFAVTSLPSNLGENQAGKCLFRACLERRTWQDNSVGTGLVYHVLSFCFILSTSLRGWGSSDNLMVQTFKSHHL